MRKIWTIAWKDVYITFADRNAILVLIAAPLAVATIVGLAFDNLSSGDVPVRDIPVAIVNLDEGSEVQNFGQVFVRAFVPSETSAEVELPACERAADSDGSEGNPLLELTNAVALDDPDAARAGVDSGDYAAAIIIPADFSAKISYGPNNPVEPAHIEVYASGGRPLAAEIIRSIVEGIASQIATGNIAAAATLETVGERYGILHLGALASSEGFARNIACAFAPGFSPINIDQRTVTGQRSNSAAAILVLVGSAQAMFFMLFTAQGGIFSIYEERRQWTLQRLIISPTPRLFVLVGKLAGTFVTLIFQLVVLLVALTLVGSLLSGELVLIWGSNPLLIGAVVVAAAAATLGLGALLAGLARTPEQGQAVGSVINVGLAVLGGAFGFALPEGVSRLSMIYWGTNAFSKLAAGQTDIGLHLLILLVHGVALFGIGFYLFNRRLDV